MHDGTLTHLRVSQHLEEFTEFDWPELTKLFDDQYRQHYLQYLEEPVVYIAFVPVLALGIFGTVFQVPALGIVGMYSAVHKKLLSSAALPVLACLFALGQMARGEEGKEANSRCS